jgi:hypothetical protein
VDREYIGIATKILDHFITTWGSYTNFVKEEGPSLTQDQTLTIVNQYLTELDIQDKILINFTYDQVAPTSVTHDSKLGKSYLNIKLPITYK